ncbi:MAG: STAS domain-containing protein [Gammaproteobacteria bacterium]|nr:STAS domain-containing protein [Gammaproteobacteria bacterium]
MSINHRIDGNTLTINVGNRFDFSVQKDFRRAYEEVGKEVNSFVIDLGQTEFMDSTACGMLLVLKDYIGGNGKNIHIRNCNEDVKKTLSMIQFDSLFNVE